MKKLLLVVTVLLMTITLSACSDLCIGTDCITETPTETPDGEEPGDTECEDTGSGNTEVEGVLFYDHIDGYGLIDEDHEAFILFEEEMQGFVKYQVAYLSCTCRPSDVNFWSVIYIEVNKFTDDVKYISYNYNEQNSNHPYHAGLWGDSSPTPDWVEGGVVTQTGKTYEDFEEMIFPWFVGKTIEDFDGISVFKNNVAGTVYDGQNTVSIDDAFYTDPDSGDTIDLIDTFTGASVSTNNMLRIIKTILEYHEEEYGR